MLQELRLFLTALQFFTRLPVPGWVGHTPEQLNQAARYFPLAGIVVGALCAAVLWLSAQVLPLPLAVGLCMVAGILITGAFHEDGLADFTDGLGGGYTREKALIIMKDSRIGAYGAIALILVLLLKFEALLALCRAHSPLFVAATLLAAHSFSRLLAASLMLTQRYIREDDSARAKPAAQQLSPTSFAIAGLTGLAALLLLFAAGAHTANLFAAVFAALLMRAYLAWRLQTRLGGYTGDCLGAVQQLTELAFYLGLLATLP
ncbi:MAG: adenosylcobinamide-GDP ribazoletransferase [Gallionellales bacterium CG03_land_8_20_14_0_80_55_15]|nr:MAG: adenosylcobinamide-GDP ribazoletransferase [Gallionellales bacterium CG03_land_8_20_14_0_80_55_15]PIX04168.1 MAG: adenosylcobinamide-GDP ribazoletransferase [Gallionellales bacterium CG_4_8_14_3_um_filter_54_18]